MSYARVVRTFVVVLLVLVAFTPISSASTPPPTPSVPPSPSGTAKPSSTAVAHPDDQQPKSPGHVTPADASITGSTLTCSHFSATGTATPGNYAAVRIYAGTAIGSGTPLIDSYINQGVPSYYAPVAGDSSYNVSVGFTPQPAGTTLVARIYDAPSNTYGSWDSGSFQDVTVTCATNPGAAITGSTLTCSHFTATGTAAPPNGYAAVRVYVGPTIGSGTPLVDSYTFINSGLPTAYAPLASDGTYNVSVSFAAQPAGTVLIGRIYRAPVNTFGSWDSGTFQDVTVTCVTTPGATIATGILNCSNFTATGTAAPPNGFVAVRVWKGTTSGTSLVDSYINTGAPTAYAPIAPDGSYHVSANFAPQPPGTILIGRIYRAPVNTYGSWDSGTFQQVTQVCGAVFIPVVQH